jgi:cytochrome c oxidase assembly protein subunit 11
MEVCPCIKWYGPPSKQAPRILRARFRLPCPSVLGPFSLLMLRQDVRLTATSPAQICQTTGWGGQPVRAPGHGSSGDSVDPSTRLVPVEGAKRIRVTFNASVSDVLPWKFTPQQREVRVLPGETALAFYTATNTSDKDIIGVATYSVTPAQTAPYFSKIQCFCFEEQRLNAGETVDMPVFFYLDPDLLNDLNMRGVETVTLSYTFFSKSALFHFPD